MNGVDGDDNSNGEGEETHTLSNSAVTARQEAYVKKVIDTVNDLDNVLYEISNESWARSTEWQYHMIDVIHNYEATKPKQHPVGMTSHFHDGNNSLLFNSPAEWISPTSEHNYMDAPPASNGSKVILSDTDHLWGEGGDSSWVWKSFTRGLHTIFMDGGIVTFPPTQSEHNSARNAMGQTLTYANKMNLAAMTPQGNLSSTGYALAKQGSEYLVYQPDGGNFEVNLAAATYAVEWLNPESGATQSGGNITVSAGERSFSPPFGGEAVLYLKGPGGGNLGGGGNQPPNQGDFCVRRFLLDLLWEQDLVRHGMCLR